MLYLLDHFLSPFSTSSMFVENLFFTAKILPSFLKDFKIETFFYDYYLSYEN